MTDEKQKCMAESVHKAAEKRFTDPLESVP